MLEDEAVIEVVIDIVGVTGMVVVSFVEAVGVVLVEEMVVVVVIVVVV